MVKTVELHIVSVQSNEPVLTCLPAYGAQYKTEAEVRSAWEEGKDFKIAGGPYFSIRDVEVIKADGIAAVIIFYSPELAPLVIPMGDREFEVIDCGEVPDKKDIN